MPRNTAVLVFFLTILAAIVVGVNLFKPKEPIADINPPAPVATPTQSVLSYQNDTCGIQFQYPNTVNKLENTSGALFSDPTSTTSAVIVTCQEEIPRVPLPKDKMETVAIGTYSATLYHDASPKDGTPIDKLIFTHPRLNLDVYIAGTGDLFGQIVSSLQFL